MNDMLKVNDAKVQRQPLQIRHDLVSRQCIDLGFIVNEDLHGDSGVQLQNPCSKLEYEGKVIDAQSLQVVDCRKNTLHIARVHMDGLQQLQCFAMKLFASVKVHQLLVFLLS